MGERQARAARHVRARARAARSSQTARPAIAPGREAARRALRVRPARAPPRPDRARLRALAPPCRLGSRASARRRPARGPRARPARRAGDRPPDRSVRARSASARTQRCSRSAAGGRHRRRDVRTAIARELDGRSVRHLSASRRDRAAFLVAHRPRRTTPSRWRASSSRRRRASASGVGRPGVGNAGSAAACSRRARRSTPSRPGRVVPRPRLARAAARASPSAALEAFVARVLGPAAGNAWLLESLAALLDSRLPLERGRRPARRPPAHAPVPHGAAAQADRDGTRTSRSSGWSSGSQ